jgi:hypothetical protein
MRVAGWRLALWLAAVAVSLVVAACGGSSGGGPDEIATTCTGPLATPGATPSAFATLGSCAQSFGGQAAHLDCATATDIRAVKGFRLGEFNTHSGSATDQKVTAASQSGRCAFTVPAGYVGFLQTTEPIQEGMVIVDFIPRSGENSVTLMLRCPSVSNTPCLALSMYSSQTYECNEVTGGKNQTLARGTFAGQRFPAPQLEINKPNRLVFSVEGDAIHGYINGRQICGGKTSVPLTASGTAVQVAQAGGSTPAVVDLIDFYVFGSA